MTAAAAPGDEARRYYRWDFDIALVWRKTDDGEVDEARFVWDSASQVATPGLLASPESIASYQDECGDDDRYEVTEPDEIADVKAALLLRPTHPDGLKRRIDELLAEVRRLESALDAARRAGAEEMRERAAGVARSLSTYTGSRACSCGGEHPRPRDARAQSDAIAESIEALPTVRT